MPLRAVRNALLCKPNQAGTLSEAKAAAAAARKANFGVIVSARSGETEDATIVHLAVGWSAAQLKVGSFARSERMVKWNEGLRVLEALPGGDACRRANYSLGAELEKTAFSLARPVFDPGNPNEVCGAGGTERDTGGDNDTFARLCKPVVKYMLARLAGHVLKIISVARVDAVDAPHNRETAGRRLVRRQADNRYIWPFPRGS